MPSKAIPTEFRHPCILCGGKIREEAWYRERSHAPKYCGNGCRIKGEREKRKQGLIRNFASNGFGSVPPNALTNREKTFTTWR